MKFLLDADLPLWMIDVFATAGHDAVHADYLGIAHYPDEIIAEHARDTGRCVVTGDFDFADIRNYEPRQYHGIVVLWVPVRSGSPYMRLLLAELLAFIQTFGPLRGKLLIVEPGRVRVRG